MVEEVKTRTRQELLTSETMHIVAHAVNPLCLNINRAIVTIVQRRSDNKNYRMKNKDQLKEKFRLYYNKNKNREATRHLLC